MNPQILLWLIAVVFFVILEAVTVSLVSIWFIGGSLAALIVALFHGGMGLQMVVFLAVSALLLALLRPILRKYVNPKHSRTNADRLVGQQALVIEPIDNLRATGAIRVGGVYWTAKSVDGTQIPVDALVVIQRIEGAKVYVSPAEVPAQA